MFKLKNFLFHVNEVLMLQSLPVLPWY